MKNTKLLMWVLFTLSCVTASAVSVEKLILKDGSVLEGYISLQQLDGNFIFTSGKAIICVSEKEIVSVSGNKTELERLSPDWQEWARKNDAVQDGYVLMNQIVRSKPVTDPDSTSTEVEVPVGKEEINNVRILEKGIFLKYLELSPKAYTFDMSEVECIKRNRREKTELTGLNDLITLKGEGSELTGQIVEQIPGKQIRLLKNDGVVESIMQNKIQKQRKEGVNPNQTLFEQSPLLDILLLESGKKIEGVIVEQFFGSEQIPAYLLIEKKDGESLKISHRELIKTQRVINPDYNMVTDVLLAPDEILIDRKPVKESFVKEADDFITFLPESDSTVIQFDSIRGKLVLEANFRDGYDADDLILMRLRQIPDGGKVLYGFTYKNLVNFGIRYSAKEISLNNTLRLTFSVKSRGHYALYMGKKKRAFFCVIK